MTYIVVKQGVYMQEVYGPFTLLTDAMCKANELADADHDNYHTYYVQVLTEDGILDEPALYAVRHKEKK